MSRWWLWSFAAALLVAVTNVQAASSAPKWASIPQDGNPFDAFGFHSAASAPGKILFFGGQNDNGLVDTLRALDTGPCAQNGQRSLESLTRALCADTMQWKEPPVSGKVWSPFERCSERKSSCVEPDPSTAALCDYCTMPKSGGSSPSQVPTARALHTGIVAGSELFVWAGSVAPRPLRASLCMRGGVVKARRAGTMARPPSTTSTCCIWTPGGATLRPLAASTQRGPGVEESARADREADLGWCCQVDSSSDVGVSACCSRGALGGAPLCVCVSVFVSEVHSQRCMPLCVVGIHVQPVCLGCCSAECVGCLRCSWGPTYSCSVVPMARHGQSLPISVRPACEQGRCPSHQCRAPHAVVSLSSLPV